MSTVRQKVQPLLTFIVLFVGYGLYAYNRKSVTYSFPSMVKEGVTRQQAGSIASSQNLAYLIGKFIAGILSDRFSARLLFSLGLAFSAISTALFASSSSIPLLIGLWFFNGLAQGAGWPAVAKLVRRWYSRERFGFYWSTLAASSNVALSLAPYIVLSATEVYGWRAHLLASAGVCAISAIFASLLLIDQPTSIGLISHAQEFTSNKPTKTSSNDKDRKRLVDLLSNPFIWILSIAYLSVFLAKSCAGDWANFYLHEELGLTSFQASEFSGSLETGGFIGSLIVGVLADLVAAGKPPTSVTRFRSSKYLLSAGFTGLCAACTFLMTANWVLHIRVSAYALHALALLTGFCLYAPIQLFGVLAIEIAPDYLSGSSHAFVAAFGSLGAVISGWPALSFASAYSFKGLFACISNLLLFCFLIMTGSWLVSSSPSSSSSPSQSSTKSSKPSNKSRVGRSKLD